ncbi:MAG: glutaredoxin 3 [Ottowia sp.]|nr:glutaredoxin 3 [Ottowia sp.]
MAKVLMYSTQVCPYCIRAENLLRAKGVEHIEKIMVDTDLAQRTVMMQRTGLRTVPQIFINDQHIGGYDALHALDQRGELDALLTA